MVGCPTCGSGIWACNGVHADRDVADLEWQAKRARERADEAKRKARQR